MNCGDNVFKLSVAFFVGVCVCVCVFECVIVLQLHAFDSSLGLSGADLCALAYYLHHCSVRVGHIAVEAGPSADDAAVHKFLGAKGLKVVR